MQCYKVFRPGRTEIVMASFLAGVWAGKSADWPCWRGPQRDALCRETGLLQEWPERGPRKLWSVSGIGEGYGTVCAARGRLYVTGMVGGRGRLSILTVDGEKVRSIPYGREAAKGSYRGTRTTPTWNDGRVYIISSFGVVYCWDADSGKKLWQVDTFKQFGGRQVNWQIAESPLVDERCVYATPGGPDALVVALDKKTGKTVWVCDPPIDAKSAYCSPIIVRHGDRRMLVTMVETGTVGIDAETGEFLWRHPHKNRWAVHPNTPVYDNGKVFISSDYRKGSELLEIAPDGKSVKRVWHSPVPDTHHGGLVKVGDYVYGTNNRGLACIGFATGRVRWQGRGVGKGSVLWADGRLYCYSEKGIVGLLEVGPDKCEIHGTLRITEGGRQHWAHPVISGGRLFIRHGDALMAFDIRAKSAD